MRKHNGKARVESGSHQQKGGQRRFPDPPEPQEQQSRKDGGGLDPDPASEQKVITGEAVMDPTGILARVFLVLGIGTTTTP